MICVVKFALSLLQGFTVAGLRIAGNVAVLPTHAFVWNVPSPAALTEEALSLFVVAKPLIGSIDAE